MNIITEFYEHQQRFNFQSTTLGAFTALIGFICIWYFPIYFSFGATFLVLGTIVILIHATEYFNVKSKLYLNIELYKINAITYYNDKKIYYQRKIKIYKLLKKNYLFFMVLALVAIISEYHVYLTQVSVGILINCVIGFLMDHRMQKTIEKYYKAIILNAESLNETE